MNIALMSKGGGHKFGEERQSLSFKPEYSILISQYSILILANSAFIIYLISYFKTLFGYNKRCRLNLFNL